MLPRRRSHRKDFEIVLLATLPRVRSCNSALMQSASTHGDDPAWVHHIQVFTAEAERRLARDAQLAAEGHCEPLRARFNDSNNTYKDKVKKLMTRDKPAKRIISAWCLSGIINKVLLQAYGARGELLTATSAHAILEEISTAEVQDLIRQVASFITGPQLRALEEIGLKSTFDDVDRAPRAYFGDRVNCYDILNR